MLFVDRETILIDKNGRWLSNGELITHEETLKAYRRHLGRDQEGYFISIGQDFKRIEVEDTAYFVIAAFSQAGGFLIRASDESEETLDPSTLAYRPERLTCRIKGGREEAKFLPLAYHEVLKDLHEDERGYFIRVDGREFKLHSPLSKS